MRCRRPACIIAAGSGSCCHSSGILLAAIRPAAGGRCRHHLGPSDRAGGRWPRTRGRRGAGNGRGDTRSAGRARATLRLTGRPIYRRVGVGLIVRYEFGGSDAPLTAGDVILLPWARSAVLLTARWLDGSVQRAMFPRDSVRYPHHHRDVETDRALRDGGWPAVISAPACDRTASNVMRLLLVLGLVLRPAGPGVRAIRLTLVIACGHALSMVALDAGAPGLSPTLVAGARAWVPFVLARYALRDRRTRRAVAARTRRRPRRRAGPGRSLARSPGLAPGEFGAALFGATLAINILQIGAVTVARRLALALTGPGEKRSRSAAARSCWAVCRRCRHPREHALRAACRRRSRGSMPPIAWRRRGSISRAVARPAQRAGGGRAIAPPRRLDDAAMIFLTVEPLELRAEVLLQLRDFLRAAADRSRTRSRGSGRGAERDRRAHAPEVVTDTIGLRHRRPRGRGDSHAHRLRDGRRDRRDHPHGTRARAARHVGDRCHAGLRCRSAPFRDRAAAGSSFPPAATTIPAVWTDPTGSERVDAHPRSNRRYAGRATSPDTPWATGRGDRGPAAALAAGLAGARGAGGRWRACGPLRRRRAAAWAWVVLASGYRWRSRSSSIRSCATWSRWPGVGPWAPSRTETADRRSRRSPPSIVPSICVTRRRSTTDWPRASPGRSSPRCISRTGVPRDREPRRRPGPGGEVEVLEVRSVRRDGRRRNPVEEELDRVGLGQPLRTRPLPTESLRGGRPRREVNGTWKIRRSR